MAAVASQFAHVCTALIVLPLLGHTRLLRALRPAYGPLLWSQAVLAVWGAQLVVTNYLVPGMGIWAVGVVVPLFGFSFTYACIAEELGPEAVLGHIRGLLRRRGPVRYVAIASAG